MNKISRRDASRLHLQVPKRANNNAADRLHYTKEVPEMGIEEQKSITREELLAELGKVAATILHESAAIESLQEQWDRALLVMEESNVDCDRLAATRKKAADFLSSAYECERQALLRITKGFMDLVTDWVVLTENDGRDLMAEFSG